MTISQTGRQEYLHPKQKDQLDLRFGKIAKLLEIDGIGDKQARVTLSHDKSQHRAEVTLNYLGHTVVGEQVDTDQFAALIAAVDKTEKQILKLREKRRDVKKGASSAALNEAEVISSSLADSVAAAPAINNNGSNGRPKVFPVLPEPGKPLTSEEAVLAIEDKEPYLVYQNAGTGRLAVLIRRADHNFDLVEC